VARSRATFSPFEAEQRWLAHIDATDAAPLDWKAKWSRVDD
jgi:hypothetical protein